MDGKEPDSIVSTILKRCSTVADLGQRAAIVRDTLVSLDHETAFQVLARLEEAVLDKQEGGARVMQALARALELEDLDYEWVAGVYAKAKEIIRKFRNSRMYTADKKHTRGLKPEHQRYVKNIEEI